jgi:putative ATPase
MTDDLFDDEESYLNTSMPLAARMRPTTIEEYIGQDHLLNLQGPLYQVVGQKSLHSMILWGPPGVGKTTLALLLANNEHCEFVALSAVMVGVKEIREAVSQAQYHRQRQIKTVLFIDEVHRFNKTQQDAFLPYIENGTFIFIGATTENPSFELNNALLSRARTYVLKNLEITDIEKILQQALISSKGLNQKYTTTPEVINILAKAAEGDARTALNLLEIAAQIATNNEIIQEDIETTLQSSFKRFDKGGDIFYEQISALHKSVRGSDPDASLYWFARMLDGGCDPVYIARRVVRMASEEVANADPRALEVCLNAWDVQTRLGSPEGELAIAQAITYLASAPKSNAVYKAYNAARALVKETPGYDVPIHLRNAPTPLMDDLGYGHEYRYAHDEPEAFADGENYFPYELRYTQLYQPVKRGLEKKIAEKLNYLKELNHSSIEQRYQKNKE